MNKNKVLIVSNKMDDAHADALINRCIELGIDDKIIRLNTEDFVKNCIIKFDVDRYKIDIKDSGKTFYSDELLSVWFRRPMGIEVSYQEDIGVKTFIEKQADAALRGLYFLTHSSAKWVNPLPALHMARHKIPQLSLAKKVGFLVPRTIVTNNPSDIIDFFSNQPFICNKSLNEPNYTINGKMYPFYTRKIENKNEIIENAESIKICPTLFQEYIDKKADIRVVVIGNDVTAVQIDSQSNKYSETDFRGIAPQFLKHTEHELPHDIRNSVLNFVKQSGLRFSSMDLVLDRNGNYYFIENNCNGQWLWLDCLAGTCLLDKMINYLFV